MKPGNDPGRWAFFGALAMLTLFGATTMTGAATEESYAPVLRAEDFRQRVRSTGEARDCAFWQTVGKSPAPTPLSQPELLAQIVGRLAIVESWRVRFRPALF